MFRSSKKLAIAISSAALFASVQSSAAINSFSEDFEAPNFNLVGVTDSEDDLSAVGWKVGGAAWTGVTTAENPLGDNLGYFYGLDPAPNHNFGFSEIATGDDTKDNSGSQYLNVYSDYNHVNAHDTSPRVNQSFVVKEWVIAAADIGKTVTLTFDAKRPDLVDDGFGGDSGPALGNGCTLICSAGAFIKTINPADNYNQTGNTDEVTTDVSQSTWESFSLTWDLTDPLLEDQILQIGFVTVAGNYENSGVYYDNVNFTVSDGQDTTSANVPIPTIALLGFGALLAWSGMSSIRKRLS